VLFSCEVFSLSPADVAACTSMGPPTFQKLSRGCPLARDS
jgi:hypothetical protein